MMNTLNNMRQFIIDQDIKSVNIGNYIDKMHESSELDNNIFGKNSEIINYKTGSDIRISDYVGANTKNSHMAGEKEAMVKKLADENDVIWLKKDCNDPEGSLIYSK